LPVKEDNMNKEFTVDSIVSDVNKKSNMPYFLTKNAGEKQESITNQPLKKEMSVYNPESTNINEKIKALNSEYFMLTKRQFELMRENAKLQTRIFKIDMEYNSGFDEFVASVIGKKSAPLECQYSNNEKECERIEVKLKEINACIEELRAAEKNKIPPEN